MATRRRHLAVRVIASEGRVVLLECEGCTAQLRALSSWETDSSGCHL